MKNSMLVSLTVTLLIMFALVGCNLPNSAPTPEPVEPTEAIIEELPTTSAATEAPAIGSCPVGTWDMTDFVPYMDSFLLNLNTNTGGDVSFSDSVFSGTARFTFNADQTVAFSADNFTQSLTMTTSGMDIPLSVNINGSSTANYSIAGDEITFSGQNNGDLLITVDVFGSATTIDESMLGQPETVRLYKFTCPDANTLSLKVIAIDDMDLEPIILTRAP